MRAAASLGRLGLAGLALLCGVLLLALARKADRVHAETARAAAEAPEAAAGAAWRMSFDLGAEQPPSAMLGRGWAAPELGSGAWSVAPAAVLLLPAAPRTGPARAILELEPFTAPQSPAQRVRARVGMRKLGEWRLTAGRARVAIAIPADLAGQPLELWLDLPDAAAPARQGAGAGDARPLAVKLRRVELFG